MLAYKAELLCPVPVFCPSSSFIFIGQSETWLFFATLPWMPASRSRLFTVDVETGVLQVLFNEAA